MLSHDNLVWTARAVVDTVQVRAGDVILSYLPLSHVAEQVLSLHTPMAAGAETAFAESLDALPQNLREVRPAFFFGVPRVWEKMQAAMQAAGAQSSPLRRRLVAWARRQGLAGGYAEQRGTRPPLLHGLARHLVFDKVRARLGLDRARLCAVSAAPIGVPTLEFFLSLGIPVLEVYGMSECTGPTTSSLPGAYRTGSAGRALPGTELKLAADGEILMRGPHVCLGYFKDPEATRETIDAEGWLHSGDVGELDADGYLRVTDRKKELLITSGGKNVAPAAHRDAVARHPRHRPRGGAGRPAQLHRRAAHPGPGALARRGAARRQPGPRPRRGRLLPAPARVPGGGGGNGQPLAGPLRDRAPLRGAGAGVHHRRR